MRTTHKRVSFLVVVLLAISGCQSGQSSMPTRPKYDVVGLLKNKWCVLLCTNWDPTHVRYGRGKADEAAELLKLGLESNATDGFAFPKGKHEAPELLVFLYDSLSDSTLHNANPRLVVGYFVHMRIIFVRDGETGAEYFFRPDGETNAKIVAIFNRLNAKYNRSQTKLKP